MYPTRFAHHSLDAFGVILEALRLGDAIARELPRGYGKLSEQLRRALLGAYLQFTEGAARDGADRNSRLRCARAEAGNRQRPSRPPSFSASPPRRGSGPSLSCSIASAPWSPGSEGSAPAELGVAAARSGARSRKRV